MSDEKNDDTSALVGAGITALVVTVCAVAGYFAHKRFSSKNMFVLIGPRGAGKTELANGLESLFSRATETHATAPTGASLEKTKVRMFGKNILVVDSAGEDTHIQVYMDDVIELIHKKKKNINVCFLLIFDITKLDTESSGRTRLLAEARNLEKTLTTSTDGSLQKLKDNHRIHIMPIGTHRDVNPTLCVCDPLENEDFKVLRKEPMKVGDVYHDNGRKEIVEDLHKFLNKC